MRVRTQKMCFMSVKVKLRFGLHLMPRQLPCIFKMMNILREIPAGDAKEKEEERQQKEELHVRMVQTQAEDEVQIFQCLASVKATLEVLVQRMGSRPSCLQNPKTNTMIPLHLENHSIPLKVR